MYNTAQYSQIDTILNVDIIKSYLFNSSIPILGSDKLNNTKVFYRAFYELSDKFEEIIEQTSKTTSFLSGDYKTKFHEYLNHDFSAIVDDDKLKESDEYKNGIKTVLIKQYETMRYICLQEMSHVVNRTQNNNISLLLNYTEWYEVNYFLTNVLRYWFKGMLNIMDEKFNDFIEETQLVNITIFISLIVIIVLAYFIIWRSYEES